MVLHRFEDRAPITPITLIYNLNPAGIDFYIRARAKEVGHVFDVQPQALGIVQLGLPLDPSRYRLPSLCGTLKGLGPLAATPRSFAPILVSPAIDVVVVEGSGGARGNVLSSSSWIE